MKIIQYICKLTLHLDSKEKDFFHFLKLIKNEHAILDIGANLGFMTYHLAKKFPKLKIHSFEPIPSNLKTLKKIKDKFKLSNVSIHSYALGNYTGSAQMILPKLNNVLFQGLSHIKHESITDLNEGENYTVEMKTIDELFKTEKIQAIKMDVENFENFVLKGGLSVITRDHPIIYTELWENDNRKFCFDLLISLNYIPYIILENKLTKYDETKHKKQNFIFI